MKYVVQWWYVGADKWMNLSYHFFMFRALRVIGKRILDPMNTNKWRVCRITDNGLITQYIFERK